MRYMTDDNKMFNTLEEATAHEQKLQKEREKKNKLENERQKRYEEVKAAWEKYYKLAREYAKDYRETDSRHVEELWDSIVKGLFGY